MGYFLCSVDELHGMNQDDELEDSVHMAHHFSRVLFQEKRCDIMRPFGKQQMIVYVSLLVLHMLLERFGGLQVRYMN